MLKKYKLKYGTYGKGDQGPKMYGILRIKSNRGWVVEVWPCDMNGTQVSDPVAWDDELNWWSARKLMNKWYVEYNRYVNNRI